MQSVFREDIKTRPTGVEELCLAGTESQSKTHENPLSTHNYQKCWEELEKIYTASNNIKIVIQNTFKMIEAQTEPIVQEKFSSLLKYVEENPNCQCFYCKAKQSIDFLKPPKDINTENCGIAIQ